MEILTSFWNVLAMMAPWLLAGFFLAGTACGVLPLTTGLRKAGAGKGAVAGFLISTPQTGVDSILATYALLGPAFVAAVILVLCLISRLKRR